MLLEINELRQGQESLQNQVSGLATETAQWFAHLANEAAADREQAAADRAEMKIMQTEIRGLQTENHRILEYLLRRDQ